MSVGYHLTAYGGRDDKLFRAGIMESGGSISAGALGDETYYQDVFDALVDKVGCSASEKGALQCLREVPFEELNAACNGTGGSPAYAFSPVIDGDFVRSRGSVQLGQHEFVRVPIIAGTNSDEGTSFGPTGINTTNQFFSYLTGSPPPQASILGMSTNTKTNTTRKPIRTPPPLPRRRQNPHPLP